MGKAYQTNKKWVFTINNSLRVSTTISLNKDFTTINNPKVFTTTNSPDFTTNNNNLKDSTTTSSHRDSTMNKRDSTTIRKIKKDARRRAENCPESMFRPSFLGMEVVGIHEGCF